MLTSNDGVIKLEVVKSSTGVLEIELNHLDAVGESVNGHLDSLSDSDELLVVLLDSVTGVMSKGTKMSVQRFLVFQVDFTKSGSLHVKELSGIEYSLFVFSGHLVEQVGVIGVLNQVNAAVSVFILGHVLQDTLIALLRANPSGKGIAHHEDGEVLLDLESFVFSVGHCNDERTLVTFISDCKVRITRQVQTVKLIEHSDELIT